MSRRLSGRHSPRQQADTDSAIFVRPRSTMNTGSSTPPASPRPPPSSFFFPFQAYPGNPDPGTSIPGTMLSRRRSSVSSDYYPDLYRPYAPFMAEGGTTNHRGLPRSSSTHSFRAPFLSPASRPGSSLWSPPTYSSSPNLGNESQLALPLQALKTRTPLPSTRLPQKLSPSDKPWLTKPDSGARLSWWITFLCMVLGLCGAGALCYLGFTEAPQLPSSQLCLVMDDNFDGSGSGPQGLSTDNWVPEVALGGFGNGEFQMTSTSSSNLNIANSKLYLTPTLTTSSLPNLNIFGSSGNGSAYTLPGCTLSSTNKSACTVTANPLLGTVINPVISARLSTKTKHTLTYGRIEVRASLPSGDWLWPSITLSPSSPAYSPAFPASGLITLLSSRGNSPKSYMPPRSQGGASNYIYSALSYGPLPSLYFQIFGWLGKKRGSWAGEWHTYAMEWDERWFRFYVDTRLDALLEVKNIKPGKGSFWQRGGFPLTAQNGSTEVVVENPYVNASANAPFDQPFYLTLSLAAGGTSGWFPDHVGNKPWLDESLTAMRDFAKAQSTWSQTWSDNVDEKSFVIDYVKMWEKC